MRLETYKMAAFIFFKFLTLKCDISRTIWRIEVIDGSLFCIFHALSFEPNLFCDRTCPLKCCLPLKWCTLWYPNSIYKSASSRRFINCHIQRKLPVFLKIDWKFLVLKYSLTVEGLVWWISSQSIQWIVVN